MQPTASLVIGVGTALGGRASSRSCRAHLLTAVASGASPAALASLLLAAATDRAFADGGHSVDFINKACECLDLIGWEHASAVLPSVVGQMVAARGAEETTAWRHPVDLVRLCEVSAAELREFFAAPRRFQAWSDHAQLSAALLGDDARMIMEALKAAAVAGASPADLGRSLGYAAALRVARFGTANEHADWETTLHVFTYANAIHLALKRIGSEEGGHNGGIDTMRGVPHGAMAVYLARYLNVPPARLPGEAGDRLDDLPDTVGGIRAALLDAFDRQRQVDTAGRLDGIGLHRVQTLRSSLPTPSLLSSRPRGRLLAAQACSHRLDATRLEIGPRGDLAQTIRGALHAVADLGNWVFAGQRQGRGLEIPFAPALATVDPEQATSRIRAARTTLAITRLL